MTYTLDLRQVQAPIKDRYRTDPATAHVVTEARSVASDLNDPRHCAVAPVDFPDVVIRSGLHPAAGGAGDTPCSGDILAAALALCEESTLPSGGARIREGRGSRGAGGRHRDRDANSRAGEGGRGPRAREAPAGERGALLLDAADAAQ